MSDKSKEREYHTIESVVNSLETSLYQAADASFELPSQLFAKNKLEPYASKEQFIQATQFVLMAKLDIIRHYLGIRYKIAGSFDEETDIRSAVEHDDSILFQNTGKVWSMHCINQDTNQYQKIEISDPDDLEQLESLLKNSDSMTKIKSVLITEQESLQKIAMQHNAKLPATDIMSLQKWRDCFRLNIALQLLNAIENKRSFLDAQKSLKKDGKVIVHTAITRHQALMDYATQMLVQFSAQFSCMITEDGIKSIPIDASLLPNWADKLMGILDRKVSCSERAQQLIPYIKILTNEFVDTVYPSDLEHGWCTCNKLMKQCHQLAEELVALRAEKTQLSMDHVEEQTNQLTNSYNMVPKQLSQLQRKILPKALTAEQKKLLSLIDAGETKVIITAFETIARKKNSDYDVLSLNEKKQAVETCLHQVLPLTALADACQAQNIQRVKWLLMRGYAITDPNDGGYYPIHCALMAKEVNIKLLELLSSQSGFDVEQRAILGRTPLHTAALFGNVVGLEWLLERGANPNVYENGVKQKNTPLHNAAYYGHLDVLCLLLNREKIIKFPVNGSFRTPLAEALVSDVLDTHQLECVLAIFTKYNCHLSIGDWESLADSYDVLVGRLKDNYTPIILPFLEKEAELLSEKPRFFTIVEANEPVISNSDNSSKLVQPSFTFLNNFFCRAPTMKNTLTMLTDNEVFELQGGNSDGINYWYQQIDMLKKLNQGEPITDDELKSLKAHFQNMKNHIDSANIDDNPPSYLTNLFKLVGQAFELIKGAEENVRCTKKLG